jgi:hypothetical protein
LWKWITNKPKGVEYVSRSSIFTLFRKSSPDFEPSIEHMIADFKAGVEYLMEKN